MCIHIRHSLAIPPIPPSTYRKGEGGVYASTSAKRNIRAFV